MDNSYVVPKEMYDVLLEKYFQSESELKILKDDYVEIIERMNALEKHIKANQVKMFQLEGIIKKE